jgi:hypothetical protein
MKNVLIISMFIVVIFYKNGNVYAQTDSIKVEYKQESIDSSDYAVRRNYKYLNISLKEERNLIKLGFKPFVMKYEDTYQLSTSFLFEKKLFPEWSVIAEFQYSLVYYKSTSFSTARKLNIGARYYYGMNNKIQQGKNANNFNGNYFEVSVNSIPPFNTSRTGAAPISERRPQGTAIQLSWGIQRRLNNFLFFDTKILGGCVLTPDIGFPMNPYWFLGLDCTIGFGHNIKKRK